jgi:tetratricopeptide (TPR) repeat protein
LGGKPQPLEAPAGDGKRRRQGIANPVHDTTLTGPAGDPCSAGTKTGAMAMRFRTALFGAAVLLVTPGAAVAGDQVLTGQAPRWVSPASLDGIDIERGPAELISDSQHRLEGGVAHSYHDSAVRIDNAQTLVAHNTLSIGWLPDKGDLTVHRLEIYRDGATIDLLEGGAEFEVIRREQGLEARLLDGELTATLAIPGLRVGDVLRTAYSVSVDDQALGDEVQVLQFLGAAPWRVGMGRAVVSWPDGEQIFWKAEAAAATDEPELRDGYRYLTIDLPLAEPKSVPRDAPWRYQRPTVLRVGSFSDWSELSRVMAPHYIAAAEVAAGGAVAGQAAEIMRAASNPLARAALATRLVQDKVSYLLDGLDGGNYLPQDAQFTWEKRYGDCKAKSVLLLALLRQMGIDAEPVLVATRGGDALPELLPVPGDFDHVIVRARIGGEDYWLDGTSAATRLANIGDVPPFHYALPLREGGADLMPMGQRDKAVPDMRMDIAVDHSAGIDLPQLFTVSIEMAGPAGAAVEAMADANDPDLRRRIAASFTERSGFEGSVLTSLDISYDKEAALGRFVVRGIAPPEFRWEDGKFVVDVAADTDDIGFNPDRARPEWRAIPVATQGPSYVRIDASMTLPDEGRGFALAGPERREAGFANTRLATATSLTGDQLRSSSQVWQALGEIEPSDIAEAKRQARRIEAEATDLVAPVEVTWRWELDEGERRAKVARLLAAYDEGIAFARDDDFGPLMEKVVFLQSVYEYDAALAVYDELIERSPSAWAYYQRSSVLLALGRRADAIADLEASYDLEPANGTAFALAKELAYAGQAEQALEVLDGLAVREDERLGYADARATVSGLLGDTGGALSLLAEQVAGRPENSEVLNAECWFRGLFNVALDSAVRGCTQAVERADNPMAALDSRAMVQFRLGNYDAAIADLDTVLRIAPAVPDSRYLRGVVRLRNGDAAGREDIETALRMSPRLAEFYARHGVAPET